jgi:hypothetical protein
MTRKEIARPHRTVIGERKTRRFGVKIDKPRGSINFSIGPRAVSLRLGPIVLQVFGKFLTGDMSKPPVSG